VGAGVRTGEEPHARRKATPVHHAAGQLSGRVAAHGARAAAGEAAHHRAYGDRRRLRSWVAFFVQRLRELGWLEGRDVAIEYRWAEGRSERYTEIAAEFVRLKVDVILTLNPRLSSQQSRPPRPSRFVYCWRRAPAPQVSSSSSSTSPIMSATSSSSSCSSIKGASPKAGPSSSTSSSASSSAPSITSPSAVFLP